MKIAAIVVTYNRQPLLANTLRCLEAQTYQPDKVFIINNASTDSTSQFLKERKFTLPTVLYTLKTNTGGAGGFFCGMDFAYAEDFDAFWIMDDDTAPRPETLEKLVQGMLAAKDYRGEFPAFASSLVLWTNGEACTMNMPTLSWYGIAPLAANKNWLDLDCCSFVSCLVTREAVAQCGLPYPEYFIWFDDAEYTYRLSKWRSGIFVPDSIADHLMPSNTPVVWGDVTEKNLWKYAHGARNQVSAAFSLRKLRILSDLFQNMVSQLRHSPAPAKLKWALVKSAISGLWTRPKKRYPRSWKQEDQDALS